MRLKALNAVPLWIIPLKVLITEMTKLYQQAMGYCDPLDTVSEYYIEQ